MQATPAAGADTPTTKLISVDGLGDLLVDCYTDATPATLGGFAFKNTGSRAISVTGVGTIQPGEKGFIGGITGAMPGAGIIQANSLVADPMRVATINTNGYVDANTCYANAQVINQP